MAQQHWQPMVGPEAAAPGRRPVILLTSYQRGATGGQNLGLPGYSYDFVAKLFEPLLRRWGDLVEIGGTEEELDRRAAEVRAAGRFPVQVSFRALHDVYLSPLAANVVVPAWEFGEVPDHEFNGDPCNNWVWMAGGCDALMVGGPFTVDAFRRAGMTGPIAVVPVPVPEAYFALDPWQYGRQTVLDCPAYELGPRVVDFPAPPAESPVGRRHSQVPRSALHPRQIARTVYRKLLRRHIPQRVRDALMLAWRKYRLPSVTTPPSPSVTLSGVVYTSIFSPTDGRKNWRDLLMAFLLALGDRPDATLVVKLISSDPSGKAAILDYYRRLDLPHRCKLVVTDSYLSDEQMQRLAAASTYYFTTTRAEGNCLPLMNYLAAGRPGVSPCHSAIGDYFGDDVGLVVDCHPEPTIWPHDRWLRCRATWQRLVFPSLVQRLQESYAMAKSEAGAYRDRSRNARQKMLQWASPEAVWPRLAAALDLVLAAAECRPKAARRAA